MTNSPPVVRTLQFEDETNYGEDEVENQDVIKDSRPDKGDKIEVFLRLRPFTVDEITKGEESAILKVKGNKIVLRPRNRHYMSSEVQASNEAIFEFEAIFDDKVSQQELFLQVVVPKIRNLLAGKSAMILAYGITNAGKTHTILGTEAEPGLIPRTIDTIFYSLQDKITKNSRGNGTPNAKLLIDCCKNFLVSTNQEQLSSVSESFSDPISGIPSLFVNEKENNVSLLDNEVPYEFKITVSYFEIYNDRCYDLLDINTLLEAQKLLKRNKTTSFKYKRPSLKIKEVQEGRTKVEGLQEIEVTSSTEVHRLLHCGLKNRQIAETLCNRHSSRSHTIFNINLCALQSESKVIFQSTLSFVDLAGSERTTKTDVAGERLKETAQINKSLMNLARCLEVLRYNQRLKDTAPEEIQKKKFLIVPYRQSKLTMLFRDFLHHGNTCMIAACSPALSDADETIHALRTASFAKELRHASVQHFLMAKTYSSQLEATTKKYQTPRRRKNLENIQQKVLTESADEEEAFDLDELLLENASLRERLAFAESRALLIESEIRDEVAKEMEEALNRMEKQYRHKLEEASQYQEERLEKRINLITTTAKKELGYGAAQRATEHAMLNYYKEKWEAERSLHEFELAQLKQKLRERNLERDHLKEFISKQSFERNPASKKNVFTQTEEIRESFDSDGMNTCRNYQVKLSEYLEKYLDSLKTNVLKMYDECNWHHVEEHFIVPLIRNMSKGDLQSNLFSLISCLTETLEFLNKSLGQPSQQVISEDADPQKISKRRREKKLKKISSYSHTDSDVTKGGASKEFDGENNLQVGTSLLSNSTPDKVIKRSRQSKTRKQNE
eukprot:jgi/Galph1/4475/GphlegSOOS_G3143.1